MFDVDLISRMRVMFDRRWILLGGSDLLVAIWKGRIQHHLVGGHERKERHLCKSSHIYCFNTIILIATNKVDVLRTTTLASLQRFGLEDLELKIAQRGALPKGGGKVIFRCGIVKVCITHHHSSFIIHHSSSFIIIHHQRQPLYDIIEESQSELIALMLMIDH